MENKRKFDRVDAKIKSEVHSKDGMTFSSTTDVSKGGIFISTPEPLNDDSEITLSLYIPGEEPVDVKGVVKWIREDETENKKSGMGIEFIGISEKELDKLKKLIISWMSLFFQI